jgi:hypothetical protein
MDAFRQRKEQMVGGKSKKMTLKKLPTLSVWQFRAKETKLIISNKKTNDPLHSPEETADWIGVKVPTLANWRHNKRYNLPYVKIGKKVKYPESGILAFIRSRTIEA